MYGMGFFMGQFFFLKYTVVYGLALTWTRAEGYKTPDPPKCIAYVYLYSDMWREFDQPLYRFIKQLSIIFSYVGCLTKFEKLLANFLLA